MRSARVVWVSALVLGACPLLLTLTATPAVACSCVAVDDTEAFAQADAVFTGTAVAPRAQPNSTAPTTLVFDVDRVYKGDVVQRQEVRTPSSSAACGLTPVDGTQLLVYATEPGSQPGTSLGATDGQLVSFLCGGSRDAASGPIPASFGEGTAAAAGTGAVDDGTDWRFVVVTVLAVAVVLLLVAAAVRVSVTRRRAAQTPGGGANP